MRADDSSILVVDDDEELGRTVSDILGLHSFETVRAATGTDALDLVSGDAGPFSVALVDLRLPDMDGLELIPRLHQESGDTEIVILTGNASLDSAIAALRENSYDYLVKPVSPELLVTTVTQGHRRWRHRKAQERLFEDRERFELIVEAFSDLVTVVLPDGTVQYESPSVRRVLGLPPGSLMGSSLFDRVHPSDRPTVEAVLARAGDGDDDVPPFEYRFETADGGWRLLEGVARLLRDQAESPLVVSSRDITERRRLEKELVQAQKMEGIGQLAGGIAHDFNNFLTGIIGAVELAALDVEPESEPARHLRLARQTAERATSLSRQLLAFSRKGIERPETFDVNSVVVEMGSLLRQLVGSPIALDVETADEPLWVHMDPGHLEQIVMNLVVNARDAISERGRIILRTGVDASGGDSSSRAVVDVRDDGQGIPEEVLESIFSPFFTTKETGTGLGLSTVRRIITAAGGEVSVQSSPGEGTTFRIELPLTGSPDEDTPAPAVAGGPTLPSRRDALVLVVEDDDAVRSLIETALGRSGYEVRAVRSAAAAVQALADLRRVPDLLLTDISLPDQSGIKIARDFLDENPDRAVLFASGYEPDEMELGRRPRFLQKPFDIQALFHAVEASLGETP